MTAPSVLYVTLDSVQEGVGLSQVLRYVEELGRRGRRISLLSFEVEPPDPALWSRLDRLGVSWSHLPFGRRGVLGGIGRAFRVARYVREVPSDLVHARSDIAATAAVLSTRRPVVWDMRAFFADQRVITGGISRSGLVYWVLRAMAALVARRSSSIIVLSRAARGVLADRYGGAVASKAQVITTCVDLDEFRVQPMPASNPTRLIFSGTMNAFYDQSLHAGFIRALKQLTPTEVGLLGDVSTVEQELSDMVDWRRRVPAGQVQSELARAHSGLSICRLDAGVSLAAAVPTKLGEFLATGRPVVVSAGLGDLPELVRRYRCGVVVESASPEHLKEAARNLVGLLEDPRTPERSRSCAEDHFSLDQAVSRLEDIYEAEVWA